jgi:hypothetical protein
MSTVDTDEAVAWAMSDMAPSPDGRIPAGAVALPEGKGCGRQHHAQLDDAGRPYIRCAICAPWLIGHVHGFAASPAGVPLTPDEQGDVEIAKRQGERSYSMAMQAMGQAMSEFVQNGRAPFGSQPPRLDAAGLKALLAGLTAEERAELLAPPPEQPPPAGPDPKAAAPPKGRKAAGA